MLDDENTGLAPSVPEDQRMPGGIYPFWFWNDDLCEEEIQRQIDEMDRQGIKGFYMHLRQGMRQPYLSEEFFDLVETAVYTAAERGMSAHIYDEYPYPSGVAGGKVVLGNPEYQATKLVQDSFEVEGGRVRRSLPRGKILCCRACPVGEEGEVDWNGERDLLSSVGMVLEENSYNEAGLTAYNRKRYFASNPTPILSTELPSGKWRIYVSAQCLVESHKYWGHFTDVLNPDAVQHFLEVTHERYADRIEQRFGRSVLTVFVDETSPGWSRLLPDAFRERYDYDLLDVMPALQDASHPRHEEVSRDLYSLRYERFCETFEEPVRDWCERHRLRYAGEKPSLRLSQLRHMDIPGCEPGHTKAGAPMDLLGSRLRGNARATASAAYFYGKEGALCECYHSLGWGGTLQDARLIADGLLLMGIRYLVPHGFFYSTHALRKHDAPPSFFFQMPFWPLFGELSRRIDTIGRHFDGTHIEASTLVVEPGSAQPGPEDKEVYERLQEVLMEEHIDFLMVDTDILQAGEVSDGEVRLRDISAGLVVVPPMPFMEDELNTWLTEFEAAGGEVIRCDRQAEKEDLRTLLNGAARPGLSLEADTGNVEKVQMVTRRGNDRLLWFLLNTGSEPVGLRLNERLPLREVPLDEGQPHLLETTGRGYRRQLDAFEAVLLVCDGENAVVTQPVGDYAGGGTSRDAGAGAPDQPTTAGGSPGSFSAAPADAAGEQTAAAGSALWSPEGIETSIKRYGAVEAVRLGSECSVRPLNPNLMRLADWTMCIVDPEAGEEPAGEVRPMPIANQLAHTELPFHPQMRIGFGNAPRLEMPPMDLRYSTSWDNEFEGSVELVMEPGAIGGDWTIHINGNTVGPGDFEERDAFVPGCIAVDVTPYLQRGSNAMRVDVHTERLDGGLVNPLYLRGEFGVTLAPPTLVDLDPTAGFERYEGNGLPFYSGVIEYRRAFDIPESSDGDTIFILETDRPFEEACEVSFNGGPFHALPWSPRRCVVGPEELRTGENDLRVRVYTTLSRAFEGERFDIASHRYVPVGASE